MESIIQHESSPSPSELKIKLTLEKSMGPAPTRNLAVKYALLPSKEYLPLSMTYIYIK
jgi:hypothetical protein